MVGNIDFVEGIFGDCSVLFVSGVCMCEGCFYVRLWVLIVFFVGLSFGSFGLKVFIFGSGSLGEYGCCAVWCGEG